MDAFEILVIILSVALAVLLVLSIALIIILIKLVSKIKTIVAKAEAVVDDVESVAAFFKRSSVPVGIATLLSNIISKVTSSKKDKEKN